MLRDTALFEGPVLFGRIIMNNPDGGVASPSRIVSDVGPFDFSGVESDGAVEVKTKHDNAAEVISLLDLSAASNIEAVTVAEIVTAWTAIASATGITASVETGTGRLKLVKTTIGSTKVTQVYGEFAKFCGIGYGYGARVVKIGTSRSIANAPVLVASARLETQGADGKGAAIVTNGYRTGATITIVDTASDQLLKAVISGADYDEVTDILSEPFVDSRKPTFTLEYFSGRYRKDDNQEGNYADVVFRRMQSCKGDPGDIAGDRNLQAKTYTIQVTGYRDPLTQVQTSDTIETILTPSAYEALHVLDV